MKKWLAAAALMAAAMSTSNAADLAVKAPAAPGYVMPAAFNWTGFYAGVHAGYAFGTGRASVPGLAASGDIDGGFGGAQLGYNWQTGNFVLGAEVDAAFADIGDSETLLGVTASTSIRWFGTARARAGFAFDRTLIYATGGFAWANNRFSATGLGLTLSNDQMHTGWTIGAGAEYAFSPAFSAKLEYLYLDFGGQNYFTALIPPGINADAQIHTVKLGVNWLFR